MQSQVAGPLCLISGKSTPGGKRVHLGADYRLINRTLRIAARIDQFQTVHPRSKMGRVSHGDRLVFGYRNLCPQVGQRGNCLKGKVLWFGLSSAGDYGDGVLQTELCIHFGHRVRPIAKGDGIGIGFYPKRPVQFPARPKFQCTVNHRMGMAAGRPGLEADFVDAPALAQVQRLWRSAGCRVKALWPVQHRRGASQSASGHIGGEVTVVASHGDMPLFGHAALMPHLPEPAGGRTGIAEGRNQLVLIQTQHRTGGSRCAEGAGRRGIVVMGIMLGIETGANRDHRLIAPHRTVQHGIHFAVGLSTAFGCTIEGAVSEDQVVRLAAAAAEAGAQEFSLSDTTGYADPAQVKRLIRKVRGAVGDRLTTLHLHNTRGLGLANAVAGLEEGITTLDASLGGLGGCPYAPGASGNLVTEDLVLMLNAMGLKTGIDLDKLLQVRSILADALPGEPLYGFTPDAGPMLDYQERLAR